MEDENSATSNTSSNTSSRRESVDYEKYPFVKIERETELIKELEPFRHCDQLLPSLLNDPTIPLDTYVNSSSSNSSYLNLNTTAQNLFGQILNWNEMASSNPTTSDSFIEKIFASTSTIQSEHILQDEFFSNEQVLYYLEHYYRTTPKKSKEEEIQKLNGNILVSLQQKEGIPSYFLDSNFDLSKPHYFNQVLGNDFMHQSTLLDQKFSHYDATLDAYLQVHLRHQFPQLLVAVQSSHELMQSMSYMIPEVKELRSHIQSILFDTVDSSLLVARGVRRKQNLNQVKLWLEWIQQLQTQYQHIKDCMEENNHWSAMIAIESLLQEISEKEKEASSITCVAQMKTNLESQYQICIESLQIELISTLLEASIDENVSKMEDLEDLKSSCYPLIVSLCSFQKMNETITMLKDRLMQMIDLSTKQTKQDVNFDKYLLMIQQVLSSHKQRIVKLLFLVKCLHEVLEAPQLGKTNHRYSTTQSIKSLLQLIEKMLIISQNEISNVLQWKDQLSEEEIKQVLFSVHQFQIQIEKFGGKKAEILSSVVYNKAQNYLSMYHEEAEKRILESLQQENWEWIESISSEIQQQLNQLLQIKSSSPQQDNAKYLLIEEEQFPTSKSCLLLFSELSKYDSLLKEEIFENVILPADVANRMLQLVAYYNREMCILILSAKALELKVIKTINPKVLLLCSEVVNSLCYMLPFLRRKWEVQLEQKKAFLFLKRFEDVLGDCTEHRERTYKKVIDLYKQLLIEPNVMKWSKMDSESSKAIESLSKGLDSLQKTLYRTLATHDVALKQIYSSIVEILLQKFKAALDQLLTSDQDFDDEILIGDVEQMKHQLLLRKADMTESVIQIIPQILFVKVVEEDANHHHK